MAEIRKHNRSLTREQALAQSVLSDNTGTVYFTTDSHTIIMNGVEYSKSNLKNLEGYFTDDNVKFNYRSTAGSQSVAGQTNGDLATIEALYGDSLEWNQMIVDPSVTNTSNFWRRNCTLSNGVITKQSGAAFFVMMSLDNTGALYKFIEGHKYCFIADVKPDTDGELVFGMTSLDAVTRPLYSVTKSCKSDSYTKLIVLTPSFTKDKNFGGVSIGTTDTNVSSIQTKNWQSFDLSLMFGIGKEPTLAEFETFLANYFPRKDYAYNEGKVLSIKSNGIKTVGFNLWDEEWELGDINYYTGVNEANNSNIRSKNYIPVFPETRYYFKVDGSSMLKMRYYDINKKYLGSSDYNNTTNAQNDTRKMPTNCYYIRFAIDNVTTYNNDICINLAWSGKRNGEYEEHWEETTPIPITTLEGTKSDGTREVMFPDGLCGIGDVHDEIKGNKAIKRIAKVDLGTLHWSYVKQTTGSTTYSCFFTNVLSYIKAGVRGRLSNLISTRYVGVECYALAEQDIGLSKQDKSIMIYGNNRLYIRDDSYTTAATFKVAVSGVMLYYELAEPIEYTLDNEFKVDYKVDDYGTEEILPENGTAPTSLPIIADIRYGINAVDTLARLHKDYVSVYPQEFNDEQKKQARKNIGINDTSDTSDLNNTLMRLMVIRDSSVGDGIYRHNLCVSQNASRFIDAGYKPVIYRRMKVKRHFAFNNAFTRVWKWIPCEEVILTPFETQGQQSAYMKIGVPNLLLRKQTQAGTDTIYIGGSNIPVSDWSKALGQWNYGSPSSLDDNNHYYTAKDFVIESCPDYIVDYSKSTHKYSQTDSYVYAHHGVARKTLYAGGRVLKAFKITLQYGFAFVEGTDITSKRVTDIIPFQLVHTPLENVSAVTSANKGLRWKFRLR